MIEIPADDPGTVDVVVTALTAGEVVVLPTETVYGLAARAGDVAATARLATLKRRSAGQALAVLVADVARGLTLVDDPAGVARAFADRWWPGPLTLVVRRAGTASGLVLGGDPSTIGVRCPDDAFVRAVADRVGPLATTSANRHGHPTPATAARAAAALDGPVGCVVDGGPRRGPASTVVDLTVDPAVVLRAGALAPDRLGLRR